MYLPKEIKNFIFDFIERSGFIIKDLFEVDNQADYLAIVFEQKKSENIHFKVSAASGVEYLIQWRNLGDSKNHFKPIKKQTNENDKIVIEKLKMSLANFLSPWLTMIKDECLTPDKFTMYFDNLKFKKSIESESKEIITKKESDELIVKLDELMNYVHEQNLAGQEVLYEDIQEVKGLIKEQNKPLRLIYNAIVGAFIKWAWDFAIKSEIVQNIFNFFTEGAKLYLGG